MFSDVRTDIFAGDPARQDCCHLHNMTLISGAITKLFFGEFICWIAAPFLQSGANLTPKRTAVKVAKKSHERLWL
jgi:hypothetical protein